MDKYDFIKQLESELRGLSDDEINSAVSYYKELFEEAGSDREQELISNLGSPEEIAESIKRESGTIALQQEAAEEKKNNTQNAQNTAQSAGENSTQENSAKNYDRPREVRRDGGTILLLGIIMIFTSPIWLSLLIAFYAVVFSLIFTVFVLAIVFGVLGICGIISGLSTIIPFPPMGLVLLGLGLVFTALTLICAPPLCKGLFVLSRAVINGTVSAFRSIFYKRGAVA